MRASHSSAASSAFQMFGHCHTGIVGRHHDAMSISSNSFLPRFQQMRIAAPGFFAGLTWSLVHLSTPIFAGRIKSSAVILAVFRWSGFSYTKSAPSQPLTRLLPQINRTKCHRHRAPALKPTPEPSHKIPTSSFTSYTP